MKKLYHVNLDKEKVEEVQKWLKKNGQTFSGYVNVIIGEIYDTIQKIEENKDSTVKQCVEIFSNAAEKLDSVKKEMVSKEKKKGKGKE